MADEAQVLLDKFLKAVRKNDKVRTRLAYAAVAVLAGCMLYFAWGLVPRRDELRITGGDILSNRHYFVEMLRESAYKDKLDLVVIPSRGSLDALDRVEKGELDAAMIQGGLEEHAYHNVRHVCTVMPETLHLVVKPGIESMKDLAGRSVNVGPESGGTYEIADKVLAFSGLKGGDNYIERHYSLEELMALHPDKLPDAIFIISTIPSFIAERLVRDNGYRVLDLPFPKSLALRYGWVVSDQIPAYTYSIVPAVPDRDLDTVGVNIHVVANRKAGSRAVFKLLQTIYSHEFQNKMRVELDEARISIPSGYPLSGGTVAYLNRDNPVVSMQTVEKLQNLFGMVMSGLTTVLVIVKFLFRKPEDDEETEQKEE